MVRVVSFWYKNPMFSYLEVSEKRINVLISLVLAISIFHAWKVWQKNCERKAITFSYSFLNYLIMFSDCDLILVDHLVGISKKKVDETKYSSKAKLLSTHHLIRIIECVLLFWFRCYTLPLHFILSLHSPTVISLLVFYTQSFINLINLVSELLWVLIEHSSLDTKKKTRKSTYISVFVF